MAVDVGSGASEESKTPKKKTSGAAAAAAAAAAARGMTPAAWADLSEKLSNGRNTRKVALSMPRFKVEFGATDLSASLRAMGLNEAFDGSGGFLAMSDDPELHLSKVIHKAMVGLYTREKDGFQRLLSIYNGVGSTSTCVFEP